MNVFVSYRRSDSRNAAARLVDCLDKARGIDKVFFDIESIQAGENFKDRITTALGKSDVCLVLIGDDWLVEGEDQRPRLQNKGDFVRMEVLAAIEAQIKVIPVLLDNAPMPEAQQLPNELASIVTLNAAYLRHETFKQDVKSLAKQLRGEREGSQSQSTMIIRHAIRAIFGFVSAAVLLLVIGIAHKAIVGGAISLTLGEGLTKFAVVATLCAGTILPLLRNRR